MQRLPAMEPYSRTWSATWCSPSVLPPPILGFGAVTYISRMTRSFMNEQLSQEYVVTARVKGLSWARTVWVHAFRNVVVQVITVVVLSYAFLLEGAGLNATTSTSAVFRAHLTSD